MAGNRLFKIAGLGVEHFEFLAECFELLLEVLVTHVFARSHADVAARIQAPTLCFNFLDRGGLAQARHIGESLLLAEDFFELGFRFCSAQSKVRFLASIETNDIG